MRGGAAVARLKDSSKVKASVDDSVLGADKASVVVKLDRSIKERVEAMVGFGGAIGGIGAIAEIKDSGGVDFAADSMTTLGSALQISANDHPNLSANTFSGNASGIGIGVVNSKIEKTGGADMSIKSSSLMSESIDIVNAAGRSTEGHSAEYEAHAEAYGGSLVADFKFNEAVIDNDAEVNLVFKDNEMKDLGAVFIAAQADAEYKADVAAGSGGVISAGSNLAEVHHGVDVDAKFAGKAGVELLAASLAAYNSAAASIHAESAGGGVVDAGGTTPDDSPASVVFTDDSNTKAVLSGSWRSSLFSAAVQSNVTAGFKAENTKGGVLAASGAGLNSSVSGSTSLIVDSNAVLEAGLADLSARNIIELGALDLGSDEIGALDKDGWAVDSAVYGAVAGSGVTAESNSSKTALVEVKEGASVAADNSLEASAYTDMTNRIRVKAVIGGAAGGVTAGASQTVANTNKVVVDGSLETIEADADIKLWASSNEVLYNEAMSDVQGAGAAGAGSHVETTYNGTNAVELGAKSSVESGGDVVLAAGRDADGKNSKLDITSYGHSYVHALIGGNDTWIKDSFTLNNNLVVDGSVLAAKNIVGFADAGDVDTAETTKTYYLLTHGLDTSSTLASTKYGELSSSLQKNSSIKVDGSLVAGTNTSSDIEISGTIVGSDGSIVVEGAVDKPNIKQEGVAGTITTSEEDVANLYWERHLKLQKIIQEYAGNSDASKEDRQVLLAYMQEDQFLLSQMKQMGLLEELKDEKGNTVWAPITGSKKPVVTISDITVSGGSIDFTTGSVKGKGSITANAAEHISIINKSNADLIVEDIQILEKGGGLKLNDVVVDKFAGFEGTVSSSSNQADPTITIKSEFVGSVEGVVNGEKVSRPQNTNITIAGVVSNKAEGAGSNVAISADGNIVSNGTVYAAGQLSMTAGGSIMQSYNSGIVNIGGSVEDQWASSADKVSSNIGDPEKEGMFGLVQESKPDYELDHADSKWVAGGGIFISGDNINVNGLIQSGYGEFVVDVGAADEKLINEIKKNWIAAGSPEAIDPKSDAYLIRKGGPVYDKETDSFKYQTAVWYDPVEDRLVVDDILPQGGFVSITGNIASTGGGRIIAVDGAASVDINAGSHSVATGEISTGGAEGVIRITDFAQAAQGEDALVWEKTSSGVKIGGIKDGVVKWKDTASADADFNPLEGQRYFWSDGKGVVTYTKKENSEDFWLWGGVDYNDIESWNGTTTVTPDKELESGSTIGKVDMPEGVDLDSDFIGWGYVKDAESGEWVVKTWTEYHDFLHFTGTNHSTAEKTESHSTIYTYTVKADKTIDTELMKPANGNSVNIKSDADVVLGGSITLSTKTDDPAGKVAIAAGGSILSEKDGAVVSGAKTIDLTASGGSIGGNGAAIRIAGRGGSTTINAFAKDSIWLAAENTGVASNKIEAVEGDVSLSAQGDVVIDNLKGGSFNLSSSKGSLTVANLEQDPRDGLSSRFDADFAGDVLLSNVDGSLYVGQIKSGGDVEITASGAIIDAIPRNEVDEVNVEDQMQSWRDAGLIGENNEAIGEERKAAEFENAENELKSMWNRYDSYLAWEAEASENKMQLTDGQKAEFAKLKEKFGSFASFEEAFNAELATEGTRLNEINSKSASEYEWKLEQLLYAIGDDIVNPDPGYVPKAGEPNIKAHNITLKAGVMVGAELEKTTASFGNLDFSDPETLNLLKKLALADVDDVVIDREKGTISVELKRPLTVELTPDESGASGVLNAESQTTGGGIYIQSTEGTRLDIGRIAAQNGYVRLFGDKGIYAAGADSIIQGSGMTLRGGSGGIGTAENAIRIHETAGADGEGVVLSSVNDIYVDAADEDLYILSIATDGIFNASAGSFRGKDTSLGIGKITAAGIDINVTDESGEGFVDLIVDMTSEDGLVKVAADAGRLGEFRVTDLGSGRMTVKAIENVDVFQVGGDEVVVDQNVHAANDIDLRAQTSITLNGTNYKSDLGGISIEAEDGVVKTTPSTSFIAQNGLLKFNAREFIGFKDITAQAKGFHYTTASEINLNGWKLEAGELGVLLESTESSIILSDSTIRSGGGINLAVNAKDSVLGLFGSTLDAAGAIKLEANGENSSISITRGSNGKLKSGGDISIQAVDEVVLNEAQIESGGSLVLGSTADKVSVWYGSHLSSVNDLLIGAAGVVDLSNSSFSSKGDIIIDAVNGVVQSDSSTFTAQGAYRVDAGAAAASFTNTHVDAGGLVDINAGEWIDWSGGSMTSRNDGIDLSAGGFISLDEATVSSKLNTALVSQEEDVRVEESTIKAKGGFKAAAEAEDQNVYLTKTDIESASGAVVLNAGGILQATDGSINVGGDASFTGKTIVLGNESVDARGSISIQAAKSFAHSAGRLAAGSAMTVNAGEDISFAGTSLSSKNELKLDSAEGGIRLDGSSLESEVGSISLDAGGIIEASDASVTAQGDVAIDAGNSFTQIRGSLSSGSDLTVSAVEAVSFNETSLDSNGDMNLEAQNGGIKLEGSALDSEGGISIAAGGDVEAGNASMTADKDLSIFGSAVVLRNEEAAAGGSLVVQAEDEFSQFGGRLGAGSTLTVSGVNCVEFNGTTIASESDFKLSSEKGGVKLVNASAASKSGMITLNAGGNVDAYYAAMTAGGDVSMTGANITLANEEVSAGGAVSVDAAESFAQDGGKLSAGSSLTVSAANEISFNRTTVESTGDLKLDAETGLVKLENGSAASESGSIMLDAGGNIEADNASITAGKNASISGADVILTNGDVSAGASLDVDAEKNFVHAGGKLSAGAGLTVDALDAISMTNVAVGSKDLLKIVSANGGITLEDTSVAAQAGDVELRADAAVKTISGSINAGGTATVVGRTGIDFNGTTVDSTGDLKLDAENGGIKLEGSALDSEEGSISIAAEGDVEAKNASMTAGGSLVMTGAGITLIDEVVSAGGSVDIDAGKSFAHAGGKLSAQASLNINAVEGVGLSSVEVDAVDAATISGGYIEVTGSSISSRGNVAFDSASSIKLADSTLEIGGELKAQAEEDIDFGRAEAAAENVEITAGGSLAADGDIVARSGSAIITAAQAALRGGRIEAAEDILIKTTTGGVEFNPNGANIVTAGNRFEIASAGGVALENAVVAAGSVNINAVGDIDMAHAAISKTEGDVKIISQTGDVDLSEGTDISGRDVVIEAAGSLEASANYEALGSLSIKTGTGSIDLGGRTLTAGQGMTISAGQGIDLSGTTATAGEGLYLSAADSINLSNALISAGGAFDSSSTSGGFDLSGLTLEAGSIKIIGVGDVYAQKSAELNALNGSLIMNGLNFEFADGSALNSSKEVALEALGAIKTGFGFSVKASSISLDAQGGDAAFGGAAHLEAAAGALAVKSSHSVEFGDGSVLSGLGGVTAEAGLDLSFGAGSVVSTDSPDALVKFAAAGGDFTLGAGSLIEASGGSLEVFALGSVLFKESKAEGFNSALMNAVEGTLTISGGSLAADDAIAASAGSNIVLEEEASMSAESVELASGGFIHEYNGSFIKADAASFSAAQDVYLASRENVFKTLAIESGGDVTASFSGSSSASINASRNGVVDGSLRLVGWDGALEVVNNVQAAGEIYAAAFGMDFKDAAAQGRLQLVSLGSGNLTSGMLEGSTISVLAQEGEIDLAGARSEGSIDVFRTGRSRGEISVGEVESSDMFMAANRNGGFTSESVEARDNVYIFAQYGRGAMSSSEGRVYVIDAGSKIADLIGPIRPGFDIILPHFDLRHEVIEDGSREVERAVFEAFEYARSDEDVVRRPENIIENHWIEQFDDENWIVGLN